MTKHVNPAKVSQVETIKSLLSSSKSVAVVDFSGLKVSQATALRQAVKKAGGQYLVVKNTLFKIASGIKDLKLEGLSGFVFSQTDEVSAIKAVAEFAKKSAPGSLAFKVGILDNRVLTAEETVQLSAIPDKNTLISKLLGSLKSPQYGLANALNWNLSKLVRTLSAIASSKRL